ncbi:acyl-CoA N-acyltransferase [Mycena rebaudengoi]|jgi:GNAT superfamily N-acetyltransferase|nr:acyl-CoA N-acyltransferase [Mycena rebaudengoi]
MSGHITIRPYHTDSEADIAFLFATFDSCVEWLAKKGLEEQWGAVPWSAEIKVEIHAQILADALKGARRWVAEVDNVPAGHICVTPIRAGHLPAAADDKPGKECFVKQLVVHRDFAGRGIGVKLLHFAMALARDEGFEWIRLDCYRGAEGKDGLVRFYERQGFVKTREFNILPSTADRSPWLGQLLEMKLEAPHLK